MKAESVKSKPIKIGELVSAFVLDLTTARRQKERGKKKEEKIISSRNEYGICNRNVSGCGSSTKETSTKDTKSTETESKDSYTIGISQFAEHGSLDNCREGFLEGLKEAGIEEGKNLKVN